MDALNLPDNYTYESQQGEDEIRVYRVRQKVTT